MWFDFGRSEGFPTQYAENKTPVTVDVLEAGLILAFVTVAVCFYIILLGLSGKTCGAVFLRITISLVLGAIIIVGNFGQEWEVGHIQTHTAYRVGTGQEIDAKIGVKIGFRSVNVTLKATPAENTVLKGETINYNERFEWTWDQGRFGFGPYAGHLQQSFREAQYRGLPLPILWVVDYFVFDGEGLRFGRFFRMAGWYSHICMWTAFATWLLANILFQSVIRYGAYFLFYSGALQLTACLVWGVVQNPFPLDIPFESGSLKLHFGSSFYVTLVGGILCCLLALAILILNFYWPQDTAVFFGIDPLSDYDEVHLAPAEANVLRGNAVENRHFEQEHNPPQPDLEEYDNVVIFQRRQSNFFTRNRREMIHSVVEEQPYYDHVARNHNDEYAMNVIAPILPQRRRN